MNTDMEDTEALDINAVQQPFVNIVNAGSSSEEVIIISIPFLFGIIIIAR